MYTACIQRLAGGMGVKTAKRPGGTLFLTDTRAENVGTFFARWPKHLTTYLCYGRSLKTELRAKTRSALLSTPRRTSAQLALVRPDPDDSEDSRQGRSCAESTRFPREILMPKPRLVARPVSPAAAPEAAAAPRTSPPPKVNLHRVRLKYTRGQPISMVTAYDYSSARVVDASGVDMLLVGDSVGMVVLGHEDTTQVTMEEMLHHCRASARGASRAMLVGDLPFGSYLTADDASRNGVRLIKEGRVDAVKLEGGRRVLPQVRALIDAGVAVMGHVGLTPQSHAALGGYRVQGRTAAEANDLLADCLALQEAGCFAIVLEMVPGSVAELLTASLTVPTIGIGSGVTTSGQVQVFHDLLGLYDKKTPKFVRQFDQLEDRMRQAITSYVDAVDERAFPQAIHTFPISERELAAFRASIEPDGKADGKADGKRTADGRSAKKSVATSTATSASTPASASVASVTPRASEIHVASLPRAPVVVRSIAEWRDLRKRGEVPADNLGLVPTMGALHDGHLSLVHLSKSAHDATAVSLFVNPKQFAAHEDLGTYPRTWDTDLAKLAECGADFVFAPTANEMYPPQRSPCLMPYVDLAYVDDLAEGQARPGFFRGVATVLTKLLNITQPSALYMGQKDGMQCMVTQRLLSDLDYDVDLVIGPTVREADGLAMSSRNVYLSPRDRAVAPLVYGTLQAVEHAYANGERSTSRLRTLASDLLGSEASLNLEYLSFLDMHSATELSSLPSTSADAHSSTTAGLPTTAAAHGVMASIAVRLGETRLIDNVLLHA